MSRFIYQVRQDAVFDGSQKCRLTFGIDLVSQKGEEALSFPDLFHDRAKAEKFAFLCNEGGLSLIHFREVLDDFLGTD